MIAAAMTALLAFAADKTDLLTDADVGTLAPVVVLVAFVAGGAYDKFVRPRLHNDEGVE